jgi:transposase
MVQIRMKFHQFGLLKPDERGVITVARVEQVLAEKASEELRISTQALLEVWKTLHGQVKMLDRKLAEQAKSDHLERVYRQIPGIGRLGSRILANELGDMSQFRNERALFSYTGLTPSEYTSDENKRLGHITREGNSRLRHTLVESAWAAIRKDPSLAEAYHRIALRAGGKRAIVAIARKLVGRARALFRTKEKYRCEVKVAA